jgi:hypothetical protein
MPNGSVSDDGVPLDENVGELAPPMQRQPPMSTEVQPPPTPRRSNSLIAIAAVAVLVVAGVVVFLLTKDDGGHTADGDVSSTGSTILAAESPTQEREAYVVAMMQGWEEEGYTNTEARCLAEGNLDVFAQYLDDEGVTPEMIADGDPLLADFVPTEAQANAMLDVMFECVDFGEMVASQTLVYGVTGPQLKCIGTRLESSAEFRSIWVGIMTNPDDEPETAEEAMAMQNALAEPMRLCGVDPVTVST